MKKRPHRQSGASSSRPSPQSPLWHRRLGWPVSEDGRLCHGGWGPRTGPPLPEGVDVDYPQFLNLDPQVYDFEAARNLPVYGSSMSKTDGQPVHREPVPKSPEFKSMGRHWDWSAYRRQ